MALSARVLARLLELQKKRAESEFKKAVLGMEQGAELSALKTEIAEIEKKAEEAGISLALPFGNALDELSASLSSFDHREIATAMKERRGPAYETMLKRGSIVKRNFENRLEIAKLSIAISSLSVEAKDALKASIRNGAVERVELKRSEDHLNSMICRFMRRCGLLCAYSEGAIISSMEQGADETHLDLPARRVYVAGGQKDRLLENMKKIDEVGQKIQVKNALRQVQEFSEDEEKEFASMQQAYLDMLREQDRILKDFDDEESFLEKTRP